MGSIIYDNLSWIPQLLVGKVKSKNYNINISLSIHLVKQTKLTSLVHVCWPARQYESCPWLHSPILLQLLQTECTETLCPPPGYVREQGCRIKPKMGQRSLNEKWEKVITYTKVF